MLQCGLNSCCESCCAIAGKPSLADNSGLGFLGGAALIEGLLGLVVVATTFTRINKVVLFWVAFVLTRPFGATFGDLLTKPVAKGGLNFGTVGSRPSSSFLFSHHSLFI